MITSEAQVTGSTANPIETTLSNSTTVSTSASPLSETTSTTRMSETLFDFNRDGQINADDAVTLNKILGEDSTVPVDETILSHADVNGDGLLTIQDVTAYLSQLDQ